MIPRRVAVCVNRLVSKRYDCVSRARSVLRSLFFAVYRRREIKASYKSTDAGKVGTRLASAKRLLTATGATGAWEEVKGRVIATAGELLDEAYLCHLCQEDFFVLILHVWRRSHSKACLSE